MPVGEPASKQLAQMNPQRAKFQDEGKPVASTGSQESPRTASAMGDDSRAVNASSSRTEFASHSPRRGVGMVRFPRTSR
jgi:hypothetical protein